MQMSKGKTGSVLMEFIIVLPIYMLLLGFAFVIGEMSLTTIHLAGSGDRTRAFSSDEYDLEKPFEKFETAASPDKDGRTEFDYNGDADMGSSVKVSDYNGESSVYVADNSIEGPWVEMTAGNVVDSYTLPPWTRGIVAYWYRQNYETTDGTTQVGASVADGEGSVNEMLAPGRTGRTTVMGKRLDDRKFGFYTLRRIVKRNGWTENPRLPYRTWGDGQLLKIDEEENVAYWKKVAHENFPDDDNASSYEGIDGSARAGYSPLPWEGVGADTQTDQRADVLLNLSN